ncbi:MAG TPA: glycosyltransferase family 39 protein [Roseiflexaceae bacterium]|nr:glycosyltransferase family 39 protein [Roseiflexaceae bacterium]
MLHTTTIARRLLPQAVPRRGARTKSGEWAIIAGLMLIGLLAHGLNMFNYPAFTFNGDEGIYTQQALAVLRLGKLSPYTYFYDHAPAGWILLAAWMALSGGPHAFGSTIDSGRMLMLLLHLAMIHRLYRIAREVGCGRAAASLAVLLFSLSPLTVFYSRPVMLDSLMLFWVLISLDLLLDGQGRLSRVALSGVCFGFALLSKETAVFLLPPMLLLALQERRAHHGRFAVSGWLVPMALVTSWYLLYAALKGELLPIALSARLFGNTEPHVSLLETLLWQIGRDGGGMFNLDNQFWHFLRQDWLIRDPQLIIAGIIAVMANLLRGLRDRIALVVGALGLLPLYYLARGGLVFNFYILFALPFFALNIGSLAAVLLGRLKGWPWASAALVLITIGGLAASWWSSGQAEPLYTARSSQAGHAAIEWIQEHLPPESAIIADDAFWPDLRDPLPGRPAFPNLHSHWKVGQDPEIGEGVFHNDWRTVDYLIMTPGLENNFVGVPYPVALSALRHARPIQRWESDGTRVELWQVDHAATEERTP